MDPAAPPPPPPTPPAARLPAGVEIRPARPHERRACRMLLPQSTGAAQHAQLYVAVTGEPEQVIGALALGLDRRREAREGWRVDLRVIVPFRRRGIGRALLGRALARSADHGIPALYAWDWVAPDGDAAHAWAALGFTSFQTRFDFETDLVSAHAMLLPLYEKVREDGWIPAGARIVPLAEADLDSVAALHVDHLGGSRQVLLPMLRGEGPEPFDPQFSRVLLLDGQVVGFTLGRVVPGGVCEIDSNVLHPCVRLGWANLWLKMEAAATLLAAGVRTIRYSSFQQHTDTRRISRQVGGQLLRTMVQMRRAVPAAAAAAPPSPPSPVDGGAAGG